MRVITGKAKGVVLKTPDGLLTRPTADRVKEALFSAIQFSLPGARVLDLFAGTGQLGIEALSRGAKSAVFVDHRREACRLVEENLRRTRLEGGRVIQADYLSYLARTKDVFDLIFLDPPYGEDFLENAVKRISEIDILADGGIMVTEHSVGKILPESFLNVQRLRDYRYGKTAITIFQKGEPEE